MLASEPSIRSAIGDIHWPAVPDQRGSALLALLFQLERSQWWPADRIVERQLGQLEGLLHHAVQSVPWYARRADAFTQALKGGLDLRRWQELPVLERSDIQAAGEALISTAIPPDHGGISEIFTSGSTGTPIRAVRTQLWELFWSAFTLRDHLWHRRDLAGKLATIRESGKGKAPYPTGQRAENWGRSSAPLFDTGPSVSLNIMSPIDQQAEWLQRENPDYLLTHPTIVEGLARYALDHGLAMPRLRQIETLSEILQPSVREICRTAWDVPLVDMYTAREAGYIALQCPDHEHYHVQAEGILAEVLDDAGRPCAPGEVGRIVVTPLHNFAMPLIRYAIGDYAEVGPPCPCGRGLPTLQRILGRRQNMLRLPSGETRWPLLSSTDIRDLLSRAPIRQYQVVQRRTDRLELRLVRLRPLTDQEEAAVKAWAGRKFGQAFTVELSYHAELERSAAGKFQDFVCAIEE